MRMKKSAAPAPDQAPLLDDPMNAYAIRIWNGQSSDVPRAERVRRVEAALLGQGYDDLSALVLPEDDQ